MLKRLALILSIILFASPALAFADTPTTNDSQLVSLYTQLISLLQQEITLLAHPAQAYLSIYPASGVAPLFVTFIVNNPSGAESIYYGDGHTTGSDGCVKNAQGWCDLSNPVAHMYQLPGTYTVTLYKHATADQLELLSTSTIQVVAPSATQYDPNR